MELNPAFRDYETRTNNVNEVLKKLRHENVLIALKGWRDEVSWKLNFLLVIILQLLNFFWGGSVMKLEQNFVRLVY